MSLGSGFSYNTNTLEDDPFFGGFPMMPSMAFPPMGFGLQRHPALGPASDQRNMQLAQRRDPFGFGSMWPFGGDDPFARMNGMMSQMMQQTHGNPNVQSFSSSSVMHYSSGEGEQPKVYHATSSTTNGPGGIKETRKTVRDSESGIQKMAIGHHIHDRAHVIEKKFNSKTKERHQHQELINLEESNVPTFNREWQQRTSQHNSQLLLPVQPSHRMKSLPALDRDPVTKHHSSPQPKHHPYSSTHHTRPHKRHGHCIDVSQAGPSQTSTREHLGQRPNKVYDLTEGDLGQRTERVYDLTEGDLGQRADNRYGRDTGDLGQRADNQYDRDTPITLKRHEDCLNPTEVEEKCEKKGRKKTRVRL